MTQIDFFDAKHDAKLQDALSRQFYIMLKGNWHRLHELADELGILETTVSANMRIFRRKTHGRHTVNKRYVGNGLWEYQLEINPDVGPIMEAVAE